MVENRQSLWLSDGHEGDLRQDPVDNPLLQAGVEVVLGLLDRHHSRNHGMSYRLALHLLHFDELASRSIA